MAKKTKYTPEGGVKSAAKDFLKFSGWFVFHVQQGMGSYPGVSDLVAVKGGRVLFLEIKAPAYIDKAGRKREDGTQSKNQEQFEADIKGHGGEYYVVRSIEDVQAVIKENDAE